MWFSLLFHAATILPLLRDGTRSDPFTISAKDMPGTPILQAYNAGFYLNHKTATFCPSWVPLLCADAETVFYHKEKHHSLHLKVKTIGGQAVFINAADGALSFTYPGRTVDVRQVQYALIDYTEAPGLSSQFGTITVTVAGKKRPFVASPDKNGGYKVFVDIGQALAPNSRKFEVITSKPKKRFLSGAWRYT